MAFFGRPSHWGSQSVYWTLALTMYGADTRFQDAEGTLWKGRLLALGHVVLLLLTDCRPSAMALIVAAPT